VRRGVERGIADLAVDAVTCGTGQITAVEVDGSGGFLATITIQPSGWEVQARVMWSGALNAGGSFFPVAVDDEVLVLLPDGDPNRAVCLPGLTSSSAKVPSSFDNSKPIFVHPSGASFATSENATTQAVVTQDLLADLSNSLTEIAAGLAAFGIPTPNTATLIGKLAASYRSAALVTE